MAYLMSPEPSNLPTTPSGQYSSSGVDAAMSYKTAIGLVHAVIIQTLNYGIIPKENVAVSADTQYGFPIVG